MKTGESVNSSRELALTFGVWAASFVETILEVGIHPTGILFGWVATPLLPTPESRQTAPHQLRSFFLQALSGMYTVP